MSLDRNIIELGRKFDEYTESEPGKIRITAFPSDDDKNAIISVMRSAYIASSTFQKIVDAWFGEYATIKIIYRPKTVGKGDPGTGEVRLDPEYLTHFLYINDDGTTVQTTLEMILIHELVHALTGKLDDCVGTEDYAGDPTEYKGAAVIAANAIYKEIGIEEQNSYIASTVGDNILELGFDYAPGATIDRSVVRDTNYWDSSPAGDSDDLLIGGASDNAFIAGEGNDFLYGQGGEDRLYGGGGKDHLYGGDNNDHLDGGGDNDYLYGGNGNDRLFGDDGSDLSEINGGVDYLYGGNGADHLYGGGGKDYLYGDDGPDGDQYHEALEPGNDYLYGGGDDDHLYGGDGNDILYGDDEFGDFTGDDHLHGGSGNDYLNGGSGNDELYGGQGHDTYIIGEGHDIISDSDNDGVIYHGAMEEGNKLAGGKIYLVNGLASNTYRSEDGRYEYVFIPNRVDGPGSDDRIIMNAGGNVATGVQSDYVTGSAFDDVISLGEGNSEVALGNGGDWAAPRKAMGACLATIYFDKLFLHDICVLSKIVPQVQFF